MSKIDFPDLNLSKGLNLMQKKNSDSQEGKRDGLLPVFTRTSFVRLHIEAAPSARTVAVSWPTEVISLRLVERAIVVDSLLTLYAFYTYFSSCNQVRIWSHSHCYAGINHQIVSGCVAAFVTCQVQCGVCDVLRHSCPMKGE